MKVVVRRQKVDGGTNKRLASFALTRHAFRLPKRGLTLAELLISMTILTMMSVVLAGMSNAVNSAWSYTKGVEETDLQARAAMERIEFMVSQTGTYKVAGQPTRLGLAVLTRPVGQQQVPDVLVVWTGGRFGGMAANGIQSRLPILGEILIYSWNPNTPSQLIEAAFPGQTSAFDFGAADIVTQVTNLLASPTSERIPLCEPLRVSRLSITGSMPPPIMSPPGSSSSSPSDGSVQSIGCVRFTLSQTPKDNDLLAAVPQTVTWTQLNWPQGNFGSRSGIRQANLQIELQVEPDGITRASDTVSAIPFFGSATRRYVYEP